MSHVVTIAGSPSYTIQSSAILNYAQHLLRRNAVHTNAIVVRDLPTEDLIHARLDSPAIQTAHLTLDQAQGVIIATPVYKASCSGVLKTFLDLLPRDALQGKTILPVAMGGVSCSLFALDDALKPILSALGACHVLHSVTITDSQVQFEHGGTLRLDEEAEQRLRGAVCTLIARMPSSPVKTPLIAQ